MTSNNKPRFTRDDYQGTPLILLNGWRACVFDKKLGILVLDVIADYEAEAAAKAKNIADHQLGAKDIQSAVVMRHTEMPASWFRKTLSRRTN